MKLQKRLLALLMAVLMMVSLFPLQTFAADGEDVKPETETSESAEPETDPAESTEPETGEAEILLSGDCSGPGYNDDIPNVHYCLTDDGVMRISGTGAMKAYAPSGTNQVPWAELRAQITSVVVEEGVTYIGSFSFQNCTALQTVQLPSTLTSVANHVFSGCTSLSGALTLPDSVAWIGDYAFNGCRLLTGDLVIPEGCTSVGSYAFANCIGFTSLSLPSTLTSIGTYAFRGCTGLKGVVSIPGGVKTLQDYTFSGDTGLTGIVLNIGEQLTMYRYAFYGCSGVQELVVTGNKMINGPLFASYLTGLKSFKVPSALYENYISEYSGRVTAETLFGISDSDEAMVIADHVLIAYQGDASDVQVPDGVTAIGPYAFRYQNGVSSVSLPDTVRSIGAYAFSGCTALNRINFPAELELIGNNAFSGCTGLSGMLLLPNGLKELGSGAFSGCTGLTGQLALPEGLEVIPASAFSSTGFEGVLIIPELVTSIGAAAFSGISGLTAIDLGSSVTSVAKSSFENCSAVTEMTFRGATVPTGLNLSDMVGLQSVYVPRGSYEAYCEALSGKMPAGARVYCTGFDGDYLIDDGVLLGYFGDSETVEIPEGVTEIGPCAFLNCVNVTQVAIPDGITSIGSDAFYGCTSLIRAEIPDGTTAIGANAFYGCTSLEGASLPESLQTIGSYAFYGCTSLEGASLPENLQTIGSYAFYGCTSLEEAAIPESLQELGSYAFYNCSKLTGTARIPDGVTEVPEYVFYNCSSLTELAPLPAGITKIGAYAFSGCSGIASELVIPNTVTEIGTNAFSGCTALTGSLILPEGLLSIGTGAFSGCIGFTGSLTIPESVTSIGQEAFRACSGFTGLLDIKSKTSSLHNSIFRWCRGFNEVVLSDYVSYIGNNTFSDMGTIDSFTFGRSVYRFETYGSAQNYAFYNTTILSATVVSGNMDSTTFGKVAKLTGLKTLYVPESAYQNYATNYASSIPSTVKLLVIGANEDFSVVDGVLVAYLGEDEEVVIPSGVTSIGPKAFYQNTTITSVTIPEGVTAIDAYAFSGCSSLMSVNLPDTLTSIGSYAFSGTALETAVIPDSISEIGAYAFTQCKSLVSAQFSDHLATIGDGAFSGCSSLTNISFPASVTTIGSNAFAHCTSLPEVTIPCTVQNLGSSAFFYCTGLQSVTLEDGITAINSGTFQRCSNLSGTVQIPDSVRVVSNGAFSQCSSLEHVVFGKNLEQLGTAAGDVFAGCTNLKTITFTGETPPSVGAVIGSIKTAYVPKDSYTAYRDVLQTKMPNARILCSDSSDDFVIRDGVLLVYQGEGGDVMVPESVTVIGARAFANCAGLTHVTLPNSVSSIEKAAFYCCSGLSGVSFSDAITAIGEQSFYCCTSLASADLPEALEVISASAFCGCSKLSEVSFPDSLQTIGASAFYGCASLASVDLPEALEVIAEQAFYGCSKLSEVSFPDSLQTIEASAFYGCASLVSVDLPEALEVIAEQAFYGCSKLSEVSFPDSLQTIGENAFYNCSYLQAIILPDSVTEVGNRAFYGCSAARNVRISANLPVLSSYVFSGVGAEEITVPDGVREIQEGALRSTYLKCVRFGSGLTKLEKTTFVSKNQYQSSYSGSNNLQEVHFSSAPPQGVLTALSHIMDLVTVYVPLEHYQAYITQLGTLESERVSNGFKIPVRIIVEGSEDPFYIEDGVLYGYFGPDGDVTVPDGVTEIGRNAFRGCRGVTSVTLPESVRVIGDYAFQRCYKLKSVNMPNALESVGNHAFDACKTLEVALVIPDTLRAIGDYAFYYCEKLTSVHFPAAMDSIGKYAFYNCDGLTGQLELPATLNTLGSFAFCGCGGLTGTLTIPDGLTVLEGQAFGSTSITGAVTIPDLVETMGCAFANCSGITSVTLGSGLRSLDNPFYQCKGITELTFTGTTVPTLSGDPFSTLTNLETIYVPADAYDDYVEQLCGKIGSNVQISTDMTRLAVSNLRAERVGSTSANLRWDAHVSGEAERYAILRDGQVLTETDDLTFRDSGLTMGQTYTYEVYGVLSDGGQTGVSKPLTVTPQIMTITDIRTGNAQNKVGLEHGNIMAYVSDPVGASVTAQGMLYYLDGETPVEIGPMPRSAELSTASTAVFLAAWDIENVPDGDYTVRFVLTDEDGTAVQRDQVVTVDHTRPAQIAGLAATDDVTAIHLTWSIAAEIDTTAYRIYRRVQGSGEFRMIGQVNDRDTLSYVDRNVRNDRVYEYYVTGVSSFGQESLPSLVVTATLIADITAPTVTKLTPASMSWLTGSVTIAMKAEDDVAVSRTELLYSADGGETWEAFAFARAAMLTGTLNTGDLPDGEIRVRALAWDAAGNESDPLTYVYRIDNTGPEAVTGLAAEATSVTITLRWNDVADNDISYFRVERLAENGSFVTQQSSIKTLGLNIQGLTPETEYTYRVVGYDVRGNRGAESEPITVRTAADTTAPVITRILPGSGYYSAEIPLSITAEDDHNVVSFTVQVSADGLTWNDVETVSFDGAASRRTLTYALSLADFPEGVVSVRAVAEDAVGNRSDSSAAAPLTQYMVDRTPPAPPAEVMASGGVGYVEISWIQGSESDLGKYSVYRSDAEDGEYVRLASGIAAVNWFDRTAQENTAYYYKVSVNDLAGNESALSDAVSAQAENDTEPPKIVSVYPEQGSALGAGYRTVSVLATDNRAVYSVLVEYSADGETWFEAGEVKKVNARSWRYAPQLPLSALEDGKAVYVRATVTDLSGNTVTGSAQHYVADLTAPTVRTASAVFDQTEDEVTVTWTGAQETDLAGYRVYRSVVGASGEKLIAQRKAVEGQTEYTCKDVDISAQAVQYVYRVEAMDSCGNTASLDADVLTIPDRTAPKAVLECDPVQEVGVEYLFDAAKSRDNGSIVSYQLDLGDGTVTDQPTIVHVYEETGEYTVTLTVTDDEGNVSVLTQTITVRERNLMGEAQILVLNDAGQPVPNAPVYFDLGEESQVVRNTDQYGAVLFTSGVGRHTVGCVIANNEWLPAKKDVIISANARAVVSITLVRQPMIEGEFEVKRMTFDEIVAHGIDISAPENQHMLQVRSTLTYGSQTISTTFVYNELTQETLAPPFVITTEDGVKHTLLPKVIPIPGAMVDEATFTSEAAVAYLDIPASASFLKEFFDVKLHIINNAASTFVMLDNTVTLNVPSGLSIVPSEATESNSVVMIPEIPGQTTSTISWILRGDKAGEYPLSADYSGKLSEFDEAIAAHFEAKDPIKVYGLDAVKLIAEVNTSLDYDALYFGLSMQNVGEAEIYLPEIGVMEETISAQLNESEANAVTVRALNTVVTNASGARRELRAGAAVQSLRPGETLTRQYAAYGAVGENHVLQLREIIAQIADSYGMPFEIIERKADLFSMDHAAEKLSAIANDESKSGEFNYILDHANFFYVEQALINDEDMVDAVSNGQYQSAELRLNYVLNQSEQTRFAVQDLVLRLLRDDALAQTAETRVAGLWLDAADALGSSLRQTFAQTLSEADLDVLNAWLADGADRCNRAEALRRDGLEGYTGRALRALEADGMSAEGAASVCAWLESTAAADVLSAALCKGSPLLTAAVERREDLSFDVASCDAILMMEAVCDEAQALPALLREGVTEGSKQAETLDSMTNALKTGAEALSARLMTALDACSDASEIAAAVPAVCGDAIVDTLITASFDGLAVPDKIFVRTMLSAETALSFALTKAISKNGGLAPADDAAALNTLKALKYLISLRIYSEKTFADQADADESLQQPTVNRINAARQSDYDTVNAYARDVSADLLRYRDDLFASGRTDPNRPEAPVVTVNYRAGTTAESFSSDYEYSFDGTHWTRCSGGVINLEPGAVAKHLRVRLRETASAFAGNEANVVVAAKPRLQGDIQLMISNDVCTVSGLPAGVYAYAFTDSREEVPTFTGQFSPDEQGNAVLSFAGPFLYLALERQADETHFASLVRFATQDNWLRDKENMFIIGIPEGTSYEDALDHYARLGLEAYITNASGEPTDVVGTGSLVDLGGEVYEAVVRGDVDGDASVNQNDLDLMLDHINYQQELGGAYLRAARATDEPSVGIFDLYAVLDDSQTPADGN